MNDRHESRKSYRRPEITVFTEREIVRLLGPAQASSASDFEAVPPAGKALGRGRGRGYGKLQH